MGEVAEADYMVHPTGQSVCDIDQMSAIVLEEMQLMCSKWKKTMESLTENETEVCTESPQRSANTVESIWSQLQE